MYFDVWIGQHSPLLFVITVLKTVAFLLFICFRTIRNSSARSRSACCSLFSRCWCVCFLLLFNVHEFVFAEWKLVDEWRPEQVGVVHALLRVCCLFSAIFVYSICVEWALLFFFPTVNRIQNRNRRVMQKFCYVTFSMHVCLCLIFNLFAVSILWLFVWLVDQRCCCFRVSYQVRVFRCCCAINFDCVRCCLLVEHAIMSLWLAIPVLCFDGCLCHKLYLDVVAVYCLRMQFDRLTTYAVFARQNGCVGRANIHRSYQLRVSVCSNIDSTNTNKRPPVFRGHTHRNAQRIRISITIRQNAHKTHIRGNSDWKTDFFAWHKRTENYGWVDVVDWYSFMIVCVFP